MLPTHLKRYVVEQDYSRYSPLDQEVWRYVMQQLIDFLGTNAPGCYIDGLQKSGIEIDRIPEIDKMSEKIERFGWRAVPVSGFIPPAAFMELQALGYLPIASDMRTVDHLLYTPAPDIVHEAAGHAPILIEPEYAGYLRAYAQVARKAIISRHDMNQYEAIRHLSDLKEDPETTRESLAEAEANLAKSTGEVAHLSEAALLGRMNWWTAEYGLIGTLEDPKLFGAGLLSSIGEARACLSAKVKKLPLTLDCINYSYDITEPQPQLFVTPSFGHLLTVLEELAETMAYRQGGIAGLEKARLAETVNTVELDSGIQISGRLASYETYNSEPAYIQFKGRTQMSLEGLELAGHGSDYHQEGFGSPIGLLKGIPKSLSTMHESEMNELGIRVDAATTLEFENGTVVSGRVTGWRRSPTGQLLLISFADCRVTREGRTLFDPAWGAFDMSVGSRVASVFGGPADRIAYGDIDDFVAKTIARRPSSKLTLRKYALYQEIRDLREKPNSDQLSKLATTLKAEFPNEWLAHLGVWELAHKDKTSKPELLNELEVHLQALSKQDAAIAQLLIDGRRVIKFSNVTNA